MGIKNKIFKPIQIHKDEGHRQSTWLELFMDLAFVISIAALTTMLVHDLTVSGLALYTGLFLVVYWAWNQLTWYASLWDNNDVFFRGMYMTAILAVLLLAASIGQLSHGKAMLFVISYVILQGILAVGWFRIYFTNPAFKGFSLKYIAGQILGSAVWILSLFLPESIQYYLWGTAMVIHIAAPYFAWKTKLDIPIHLNHIIERYCLLTIIVLGETLVAVATGVSSAPGSAVFLTTVCGYIIAATIWWTYFNWDFKAPRHFRNTAQLFVFGYGHFVIFLAIAAFGAGLETVIHSAGHGGHLSLMGRLMLGFAPSLYLIAISIMNMVSWDMKFDRKMMARFIVGISSLCLALFGGHISALVYTAIIALLMILLVGFELLFCSTEQATVKE